MSAHAHLLELEELKTYFYTFEGIVKAVDGVSFYLDKGEILGIVGESGCGKSVTAQSIMKLIPQPPGKIVHGQIRFEGENLVDYSLSQMQTMCGSVLTVKQEAYIMAAKATGAKDFRLLLKHLAPNAIAPIFVVVAVDLAVVIMLEATLSFLGVGVPMTEPSLGMMISSGRIISMLVCGGWSCSLLLR